MQNMLAAYAVCKYLRVPIKFFNESIKNFKGLPFRSSIILNTKSKLIIFRFPNVVGTPATHGVIYDFLKRLIKDKTSLQVLGNGFQMKPYLLCDDLIQIMIFLTSNIKNNR